MEKSFSYEIIDEITWEENLLLLPNPNWLQSNIWADIKKDNGWVPSYLLWKDNTGKAVAGAMVLERKIQFLKIFSLKIQYCPKGPLFNWNIPGLFEYVLADLEDFAKSRQVIFLKIDPDIIINNQKEIGLEKKELPIFPDGMSILIKRGWSLSKEQIQFRNTLYLLLDNSEDKLMSAMKQKTRYNIRLSERKGVKVRIGNPSDFEELYKLYAETAIRDGFVIRSKVYYLNIWNKFFANEMCEPLIAELDGQLLAAIIIYYFSDKAYYVYGMSSEKHRNLMATYLLQWKAIQRAKEKNKKIYDFWGAPEIIDETDRMWGVYKFKLGFGGILINTIGAYDYPINRIGYSFYQVVLPKILDVMRKIGFLKIKSQLD